jgi:hypothetical protein
MNCIIRLAAIHAGLVFKAALVEWGDTVFQGFAELNLALLCDAAWLVEG